MARTVTRSNQIKREFLVAGLALLSIVILMFELIVSLSTQQRQLLEQADLGIAFIFLFDFIIQLVRARDRVHFLKSSWWELLAAIPITSSTTTALRTIKLIRVLPIIEGIRLTRLIVRLRIISEALGLRSKKAAVAYFVIILTSILSVCSIGFYRFEFGVNPQVHNFGDSLWWVAVTVATIGYGDIYPVTLGGRIIALGLILTGIASFGVMIGLVESVVVRHTNLRLNK